MNDIASKNETETVYYPLTRSQQAIVSQEKFSLHKGLMQMPIALYFERSIEAELMRKAVNLEIERNDCLRLRFVKNKDEVTQYFVPAFDIGKIGFVDFTGKTKADQDKYIMKFAKPSLDYYGGVFGRFCVIKSHDGRHGLLCVVSHLNMDAWGLFLMIADLFAVYDALENNKELPAPLASSEECLKKELTYNDDAASADEKALIELYEKDGPFDYARVLNHDVTMPEAIKKRALDKGVNRKMASLKALFHDKSKSVVLGFDSDMMKRMFAFCEKEGIAYNNLFNYVIRTYLSKINNSDDIMFSVMCNRRGTMAEKKSGGCRVGVAYLRSVISPQTTVREAINELDLIQKKLYRHLGYGAYSVARNLMMEKFDCCMHVNGGSFAFSLMPPTIPLPESFELDINWVSTGYLSSALYMFTLPGKDGAIKLNYEYRVYETCAEQVYAMHEALIKIFELCMKDPDMTTADILKQI